MKPKKNVSKNLAKFLLSVIIILLLVHSTLFTKKMSIYIKK